DPWKSSSTLRSPGCSSILRHAVWQKLGKFRALAARRGLEDGPAIVLDEKYACRRATGLLRLRLAMTSFLNRHCEKRSDEAIHAAGQVPGHHDLAASRPMRRRAVPRFAQTYLSSTSIVLSQPMRSKFSAIQASAVA